MPATTPKPRQSGSAKRRKSKGGDVDEEAELEARLFGKKKRKSKQTHDSDDDDSGMGWMQDSELFTVDVPLTGDVSEDDLDDQMPTFEVYGDHRSPEPEHTSSTAALWEDPADNAVTVSLQSSKRLKKLGRAKQQDKVTGGELQSKLREQFERLHPKPQWASMRVDASATPIQRLLNSTASFLDSSEKRGPLPPGFIDIQRVENANAQNPTAPAKKAGSSAGVVDFAWHPSPRIPVMAVAGGDRRVRLFNIDGHTNTPLLTLHIPSLPLGKSTFHPSGSSLLLTGSRPFYYTYDLAAQTCIRSPRNLFGSAPTPTSPQSLSRNAFSPDGSLLAVAGRRGAVSILEWGNGGSTGVVVAELKSGRGGSVADMAWTADGELSVLGGRNGDEVEVWDIGERKVSRKWRDDAAFGGQIMRQGSGFTAIGSSTGIVNLYKGPLGESPKGKSLEHLTTAITSLNFHPSGELMVSASTAKNDALKLYHLGSGSAFANWPTLNTPLGHVTQAAFSTAGEYLAAGNTRGQVLLWSLKHYAN